MSLQTPFTEGELSPILEDFFKNGATIIRNVLSTNECEQMRERIDQISNEPYFSKMRNVKIT